MSAIGKGDWVECVDDSPGVPRGARPPIARGQIAQVAAVKHALHWIYPHLRLEGDNRWFWVARYRPIYRPKADLIASLKALPILAPVKKELEPAGGAHDARRTAGLGRPY